MGYFIKNSSKKIVSCLILSSQSCAFHHLVEISDKIGRIDQLASPKCSKMVENDVKWVQMTSQASFKGSGSFRMVSHIYSTMGVLLNALC